MSIATEIQELTQNTAELTTIRGDIRTALAGKGVTATDHDYADFAADVEPLKVISKTSGSTIGTFNFNGVEFKTNTNKGHFQPLINGAEFSINFNSFSEFRICVKAKISSSVSNPAILYANTTEWFRSPTIMQANIGTPFIMLPKGNQSTWQYGISNFTGDLTEWNTWILYFDKTKNLLVFSVYNESGELKGQYSGTCPALADYTCAPLFGGCINGDSFNNGEIDIMGCFIETNNTLKWGNSILQQTTIGIPTE